MLKRLRGTPIPPMMFIVSQAIAAFVVVAVTTVVINRGRPVCSSVSAVNWSTLPALVISLFVGAGAMSILGLALTAVIHRRRRPRR